MCSPTSFQRPLDGGRPGWGWTQYTGFENLYRCTPPRASLDIFILASITTKASSFFRHCLFVFGRQIIYRQRINAGPWNMSCTKVGLF